MGEHGPAWGYDPVRELQQILEAHPRVTYLAPRMAKSGMHTATWEQPSADPAKEGAVVTVEHEEIRELIAELHAQLGPGIPQ
jgi:hypothetical protein